MKQKIFVVRHCGMTLIEVMIALMVFAIGVLGVLNALTWSIGQSAKTKTTLQAQMLAQEGMELVFATRNSNIVGYRQRNCLDTILGGGVRSSQTTASCTVSMTNLVGSLLGVSFDPFAGIYGMIKPQGSGFDENWKLFQLDQLRHPVLKTQRLGYTGGIVQKPSAFARYVTFLPLTGSRNSGLVLVTVSVLVNDAVYRDTRTLQSMIGSRE